MKSKIKSYDFMAYALIIIFALFWSVALTAKYLFFGYGDWDLAFFNQAMWNLLHGELFSSLFNVNFLGNHANFISFIFLPFYALFPNALFLIYLKIICYGLGAVPLFLIAKKILNASWGMLFVFLYFFYLPSNYAIIYDFDWENLAIFFIPWLFYFYWNKKFRLFCIFSLCTILIKENMPLGILMFGIHAFLTHREKKWWLFCLLLGGIWFYCSVFLIIPFFLQSRYHGYVSNYSVLTKDFGTILRFLFSSSNRNFIAQLFSLLAFLPILRLDILFLGLPFFLQHMLSSALTERSIYYNYSSALTPFIFIAAIFSVKSLLDRLKLLKKVPLLIASCMTICTTMTSVLLFPNLVEIFSLKSQTLNIKRWQLVRMIPPHASVLASFIFLPALSSRKNIYAFHDVYRNIHYKNPHAIASLDYLLIYFNDVPRYLYDLPSGGQHIHDFFNSNHFGVVSAIGDTILFKRDYVSSFKLFEKKDHGEESSKNRILINQSLSFVFDHLSGRVPENHLIPFRFYWHCKKSIKENYMIRLFLTNIEEKKVYNISHPICYHIKPTSRWQEGEFIEENYNFLIPDLPRGKYFLRAEFFDFTTGRIAPLWSDSAILVMHNKIANLGVIVIG